MIHIKHNEPEKIGDFTAEMLQPAYHSDQTMAQRDLRGTKMNGKPVLYRDAKTVLTIDSEHEFRNKWLCDGITANFGDACAFSCGYCYVGSAMRKVVYGLVDDYNATHGTNLAHSDFVIRRRHSLELLEKQLLRKGLPIYHDPHDNRTVYMSTLVDVAGNMEILRETAAACCLILKHTSWQIRFLSKSSLLSKLVSDRMIPEEYHHRLIFGFSTGTLDDSVARTIEHGTASVSKRLKSLHWLQDNGFRTYAMVCPSLPQRDYREFSQRMCEAVRIDKCEEVWAEVINVRGESFTRTLAALDAAGFNDEAIALSRVSGPKGSQHWEQYARDTFLAHAENVSPEKLRFLHYPRKGTVGWWAPMMKRGAILLGSEAKNQGLTTTREKGLSEVTQNPPVAPPISLVVSSTKDDRESFDRLNTTVSMGMAAFMDAGRALREIHERQLWKAGGFESWESYCRETAGSSRSYIHRLMSASKLAEELSLTLPNGNEAVAVMPRSESQVRPLSKLPDPVQRQKAWNLAVKNSDGGQPTAQTVSKAVSDLSPQKSPEHPLSAKERRQAVISEMKAAVQRRESWEEVARLVEQLESIG